MHTKFERRLGIFLLCSMIFFIIMVAFSAPLETLIAIIVTVLLLYRVIITAYSMSSAIFSPKSYVLVNTYGIPNGGSIGISIDGAFLFRYGSEIRDSKLKCKHGSHEFKFHDKIHEASVWVDDSEGLILTVFAHSDGI